MSWVDDFWKEFWMACLPHTEILLRNYFPLTFEGALEYCEIDNELSIYFLDIPYYLKLPERGYKFEKDGIRYLFRLKTIKTDNYVEEEPLDEGEVSLSHPIRVFTKQEVSNRKKTFKNKDPKYKGYDVKYTSLEIVCHSKKKEIGAEEIKDAVNKFVADYASFSGDSTVMRLLDKDFDFIYSLLFGLDPYSSKYIILGINNVEQETYSDAVRLDKESAAEFESEVLTTKTSKSARMISKASKLHSSGFHTASIFYAEKALESALDSLLEKIEGNETIIDFLNLSDPNNFSERITLISVRLGKDLRSLQEYRDYSSERGRLRNEIIHEEYEASQEEANRYLRAVASLIEILRLNIIDDLSIITPSYVYPNGKDADVFQEKDEEDMRNRFGNLPDLFQ